MNWYEKANKVQAFVDALTEAGVLESATEVNAFVRKPWKFDEEYIAWANNGFPSDESEDGWSEFIDALENDEEEEEEESSE